jgi:DNA-binding Lrp family transcriptional regulator
MKRAVTGDASRSKYMEVMSKELPKNLTRTGRRLLYHLAYRHNTEKGYSFPGETELAEVLGVTRGTVRKSIRELKQLGLIKQLSAGYRNHRAEYVVTVSHLPSKRVSVATPIKLDKGYPLEPERVSVESEKGIRSEPKGYPHEHPITTLKTINDYQLGDDFFSVIPKDKHFNATPEFLSLLEQVKQYGTSYNDLKAHLKVFNWFPIYAPKEFVISLLKEKLAKPPRYSSEVKPKWCGNCDEVSRKLSEPVDIPNGNGAKTIYCLKCDPFIVNRLNGY